MAQEGWQSTYSERLRDPRWQKLRLEIMQRDKWMCSLCHDSESTIMMHHHYYLRGKDPWDYPLNALVTLCEHCHERETRERREAERHLLQVLREAGWYATAVRILAEAFSRLDMQSDGPTADFSSSAIAWAISHPILGQIIEFWYLDELARREYGEEAEAYKSRHERYSTYLQQFERLYFREQRTQGGTVRPDGESEQGHHDPC